MTGWVTTEFRLYRPDVVPVLIETDAFFAGVGTLQVGFGPVSEQDREDARRNGVAFQEFPVALQSVAVMVNPDNGFVDCLTVAQLRALWRPDSDITTWRDLDPDWPDEAINLAGPTPDRPAFDLFTEAVIGQTGASRDDYSASPEGGIVIQFVNTSPNGLGYGLYGLHIDEREVKLVAIETAGGGCATPSHETIRRGEYAPLTRQHTILVNIFALDYFPAVRDFLEFYVWTALDLSYQYWHVYVPISEEQMNTNLENLAL